MTIKYSYGVSEISWVYFFTIYTTWKFIISFFIMCKIKGIIFRIIRLRNRQFNFCTGNIYVCINIFVCFSNLIPIIWIYDWVIFIIIHAVRVIVDSWIIVRFIWLRCCISFLVFCWIFATGKIHKYICSCHRKSEHRNNQNSY